MDEGEPLEQAAARELQEETSVDPSSVLLTQARRRAAGKELLRAQLLKLACLQLMAQGMRGACMVPCQHNPQCSEPLSVMPWSLGWLAAPEANLLPTHATAGTEPVASPGFGTDSIAMWRWRANAGSSL